MSQANAPDPAFSSAMRRITRATYADVWRRGNTDQELAGEDAALFQVMKEHPEYSDYWERAEELADQDVLVHGVNPFLHAAVHLVIERQIQDRHPPETDQALFRLTRKGLSRHEALHHILGVFAPMMQEMLLQRTSFDLETYRRRLRALRID